MIFKKLSKISPKQKNLVLENYDHVLIGIKSLVSMSACYQGGPNSNPGKGENLIHFLLNRKFN